MTKLLCLVGRHGAGKTTIGRALESAGYKHISVGLLRRLAHGGQFPADVPITLMNAMRRSQPGAPLSTETALKLLKHAGSFEKCVIDGFPSVLAHLEFLPKHATIGLVWVPSIQRTDHLHERSRQSKRIWTPGLQSKREDALPTLLMAGRKAFRTVFIPNRGEVFEALERITRIE